MPFSRGKGARNSCRRERQSPPASTWLLVAWRSILRYTVRCLPLQVVFGVWRSSVARSVRVGEVIGSNPVTPTARPSWICRAAFFISPV